MSRQPPTKSPANYNDVQKEQVFKGKTSSQPDPYQSGGDGEANANCQGTNAKVGLYNSSLGAELPRVDQPPHGTAPNWEAVGSRQSSADSATKNKDKTRPSTESPRSSTRQEPSANERRAGETRQELLSRSRQDQENSSAEKGRVQAWRDADSKAAGTSRHGESSQYPRSPRGEGAQSRNQSFQLPEGNGED